MRIYIRHIEKIHTTGKHKLDNGMVKSKQFESYQLTEKLITLYGMPRYIVCSPYLRTRETASIMLKYIKDNYNTDNIPDIRIDKCLSEYNTKNKNSKLTDFTDETLSYGYNINESYIDMEKRIREHDHNFYRSDCKRWPIWFITHGTIMGKLCSFNNYKYTTIPNLSCIIFNGRRGEKSKCYLYSNDVTVELIRNT